MLKSEIEALKDKLNHMIDEGADFDRVYDVSIKLDRLIVRYYIENYSPAKNNMRIHP